ncbi:MAG TPA: methyltransferase domain-containing protein [Dehalococcoidia bacterium]|nr:methyltransferase domain-containing protein [Dehalococcoidia bacterium]
MPLVRWRKQQLRGRFYQPAFRGMYDRFSDVIHEYVRSGDLMLDAGCGSGRVFQYSFDASQRPRLVVGVDVTDEPRGNHNLDAAARADLEALPLRDGVFDIAVSSHVAEHLTHPERVFAEIARVLKPGGRFLLLTPNRWHYVTVSSALLPHTFHLTYNRWRGVDAHDIFPTVYRANTARRLRSLYRGAGFEVEHLYQFETEPEYLAFSTPTYALGVAFERLVNRFDALRGLRVNLLAVGRKRA